MNEFVTFRMDNVHIHLYSAGHFEKKHMQMRIIQPLSRDTVTALGILPHVWFYASETYPSPRRMTQKLDAMYGARINKFVSKEGQQLVIQIHITTVHDLAELQICHLNFEAMKFVLDVLNKPLKNEGCFPESVVERQKSWCLKQLASKLSPAETYAMQQCLQMSNHEIISELGYEADYEAISGKTLGQLHDRLLQSAEFHIYVAGNFTDISDTMKRYTELLENTFIGSISSTNEVGREQTMAKIKKRAEPRTVFEFKGLHHSLLNMSFQTGIDLTSKYYFPLMLFIVFLWGLPTSRLLVNVREKSGLAYHIIVRHDASTGMLVIQLGIKASEWETARYAVQHEIVSIQRGEFKEQEFRACKLGLQQLWIQQMANAETLINLDFARRVAGTAFQIDSFLKAIDSITPEALIETANRVIEDCTYVLHNEPDLEGTLHEKRENPLFQ